MKSVLCKISLRLDFWKPNIPLSDPSQRRAMPTSAVTGETFCREPSVGRLRLPPFLGYLLSTSDIPNSVTGSVKLLFWWRGGKLCSKQKTQELPLKVTLGGSQGGRLEDSSPFGGEGWSRKASQRRWPLNEDQGNRKAPARQGPGDRALAAAGARSLGAGRRWLFPVTVRRPVCPRWVAGQMGVST